MREADSRTALQIACATYGLDARDAQLIHHYSNAVYLLSHEPAVARVTTGHDTIRRIRTSQTITSWLVCQHSFPATAPLAKTEPVAVNATTTVSFWVYHPQPVDAAPGSSTHLAEILRRLHQVDAPPVDLEPWIPLASLENILHEPPADVLRAGERAWLLDQIQLIREEIDRLCWPLGHGLIHGDAWAGNLLHNTATGSDAMLLCDWDWVSYGPREIDLIPTWHAAIRYGRGAEWAATFAGRYGYDLAASPGFPILMRMRDLVQVSGPLQRAADAPTYHHALRQRLDAIRSGDTHATWVAL